METLGIVAAAEKQKETIKLIEWNSDWENLAMVSVNLPTTHWTPSAPTCWLITGRVKNPKVVSQRQANWERTGSSWWGPPRSGINGQD